MAALKRKLRKKVYVASHCHFLSLNFDSELFESEWWKELLFNFHTFFFSLYESRIFLNKVCY